MKIDYKKTYYYVIIVITFFILIWGAIDFCSAGVSFLLNQKQIAADESDSRVLDDYYSNKMAQERLIDSLSRLIIAGGAFAYCRYKVTELEGGE